MDQISENITAVVETPELLNVTLSKLISWRLLPNASVFKTPDFNYPISEYPYSFKTDFLVNTFYPLSLHWATPLLIGFTYFTSVHVFNKFVLQRQIKSFKLKNPDAKELPPVKKLPAVPFAISTYRLFKWFVLLHNVFLCVYSVWTFIGMNTTIYLNSHNVIPQLVNKYYNNTSKVPGSQLFWNSICDIENGIWYNRESDNGYMKGLSYWSYLFYLSKYYEILDTVIILLKGRQSSLLQSYHHTGAILSMWAGTRFASPPIWIFVVFNSFIHSIMYFYFSLSCLKIRVPVLFKQCLTTLQITQFVVGGSLAVVHLFVSYFDVVEGSFKDCIQSGEKALALIINVVYLAPLTVLFGAFYIESYRKSNKKKTTTSVNKKNN
ncbi:unnamed protein product [Ambrosiozyma monospora]|uniref:Elongation of fatty acids protein n=1 Tax=Ambrosiozyma monospora TaxID=43982 RepID=A0A9W6YS40_AMBMO|nr:unnamed protein product [Ambrosiozyma monospora]